MSYKLDQDTHLEILETWGEPPEYYSYHPEEPDEEWCEQYYPEEYNGSYDPYDQYYPEEPDEEWCKQYYPEEYNEPDQFFREDILKEVTIPVNRWMCDLHNCGVIINPNSTEYKALHDQLLQRQLNSYLNTISTEDETVLFVSNRVLRGDAKSPHSQEAFMNRKMSELDSNHTPNTYKKSEEDADLPFWQKLYERFFGTKEIELEYFYFDEYQKMQAEGVDRRINFKDRKPIYVEEKLSKTEYDCMFIELYDDTHEDDKGWFYTINPDLCDYLVYGYKDTMKFYIIPFRDFQSTYSDRYRYEFPSSYPINDEEREPGNITKGWLIPWEEILNTVPGSKCIQLSPLAPEPPDQSYKDNAKAKALANRLIAKRERESRGT